MARLRVLKPRFFTNEDLADVCPLGRLLFQGLWCWADREGRLEDRPKRIKIEILPYDDCDVDELLEELQGKGFILRYESGGQRYIQVVNFKKHQSPHIKEGPSTIPAPDSQGASTDPAPDEPICVMGNGDLVMGNGFVGNGGMGEPEPPQPATDDARPTRPEPPPPRRRRAPPDAPRVTVIDEEWTARMVTKYAEWLTADEVLENIHACQGHKNWSKWTDKQAFGNNWLNRAKNDKIAYLQDRRNGPHASPVPAMPELRAPEWEDT